MEKLATFTTTDEKGQDVLLSATDIRRAFEHPNGARILFWDDSQLVVTSTPAQLQTSINTLWDEFTAALGDP